MVCDGIVHCNEAEDERNCGNVTYDGEKTCTGLWCQLAGKKEIHYTIKKFLLIYHLIPS